MSKSIKVNPTISSKNDSKPKISTVFIEDEYVSAGVDSGSKADDVGAEPTGSEGDVLYTVEENPPLVMGILLGLQHYLSVFVATLTIPFLLSKAICMGTDLVGQAEIIATIFVAAGIITLLQAGVGVRLPIVQAGTFALMAPTLSYFELDQWKCPDNILGATEAVNVTGYDNVTWIMTGSVEHREIWQIRMREIQGAIMLAALLEVFLGASGAIGYLLRFLGPLTIFPVVSLLGLGLMNSVTVYGSQDWKICILTILLITVFSQYLGQFQVPVIGYNKEKGFHKETYPLFKMFPIVLGIAITWFICFILTTTDVLPSDSGSRTDLKTYAIVSSPWFRIPYPGQWGLPTVSVAAVCALLSGIISTTIESVGDYYACAKLAGAPPPPLHAINRGILVEGLGSFLAGALGSGNGTTSASINVGVVGITKVGSRRVVQFSAMFMIVLGCFTKFGAIFTTIPDPIIGASFFILFSMIVAVGISNLQHVNMNSSRNLFVIGTSLFFGMSIPAWVRANQSRVRTGNLMVDSILTVLLSTNMVVGGVIGCLLDNTLPGTKQERGLAHWEKAQVAHKSNSEYLRRRLKACYDLPFGNDVLGRYAWTSKIPILPQFKLSSKENGEFKN